MLIKIVLIAGLIALLIGFLAGSSSYQIKAGAKISMLLFTVMAVLIVTFPNIANDVAHFLGVGDGANLLLYMLTLVFIFFVLQNYIKDKRNTRREAVLARKIALLEAQLKTKGK
jgi:hypothetical protein